VESGIVAIDWIVKSDGMVRRKVPSSEPENDFSSKWLILSVLG